MFDLNKFSSVMKVRQGCYPQYKKAHDELWPEMAEILNANQISMVIYFLDPCLFIFGMVPDEQSWLNYQNSKTADRWNQYMAEVLETDSEGNLIALATEEAFVWGMFKDKEFFGQFG